MVDVSSIKKKADSYALMVKSLARFFKSASSITMVETASPFAGKTRADAAPQYLNTWNAIAKDMIKQSFIDAKEKYKDFQNILKISVGPKDKSKPLVQVAIRPKRDFKNSDNSTVEVLIFGSSNLDVQISSKQTQYSNIPQDKSDQISSYISEQFSKNVHNIANTIAKAVQTDLDKPVYLEGAAKGVNKFDPADDRYFVFNYSVTYDDVYSLQKAASFRSRNVKTAQQATQSVVDEFNAKAIPTVQKIFNSHADRAFKSVPMMEIKFQAVVQSPHNDQYVPLTYQAEAEQQMAMGVTVLQSTPEADKIKAMFQGNSTAVDHTQLVNDLVDNLNTIIKDINFFPKKFSDFGKDLILTTKFIVK